MVSGDSSDFALNRTAGQVMRWNPCAPIHWRLDSTIAQAGALNQVNAALGSLSSATGMTFVYDGTTAYTPQVGTWNLPDSVVVSFGRHSGLPMGSNYLSGAGQIGEGGWRATGTWNGSSVIYKINQGYVVIDTDVYNRSTSGQRTSALLHELGHAAGLNHAALQSEVMYPSIMTTSPTYYAQGDLSGLRAVGRGAGCL